jgi:acetoin utilization protein AcuB
MLVVDLMRRNVTSIGASDTLADAVAAMVETEVSALPVLDERGKPVGLVTNREILTATLGGAARDGRSRSPDMVPVVEFMGPWPHTVEPDTSVDDAARMMSYLDLKRVFVMEGDTLVGVLSQTDIVDALARAKFAAAV